MYQVVIKDHRTEQISLIIAEQIVIHLRLLDHATASNLLNRVAIPRIYLIISNGIIVTVCFRDIHGYSNIFLCLTS